MPIGKSIGDFFLGQSAKDVKLDPQIAESERVRRLLAQRAESELTADKTSGEMAAEKAGVTAAQRLASSARGTAAGTRGPGALFAQQAAQRAIATGSQDIAGQTARAAAEAGRLDRASAAQQLGAMTREQEAAKERERLLREEMRKPGFLGTLGAIGGAGLGALAGGPGGARAGAGMGSALGRSFER